jgi:hypothetical protein
VKICTRCSVPQSEDNFGARPSSKDGLHPWCRPCRTTYARELARTPAQQEKRKAYYEANKAKIARQAKSRWEHHSERYVPSRARWKEENRERMTLLSKQRGHDYRAWVDSLKAGIPCQDCNETHAPYVMEYDHVRGTKRFNIGKMSNHKRERVLEEIAKCDLVCCVCHRVRSHSRRPPAKTVRLVEYRSWMETLKKAPCSDCHKTFPPEAMDYDHVFGAKDTQITDMWSWGREKVVAELAKCQLVCANCHRKRTVQRLRASQP